MLLRFKYPSHTTYFIATIEAVAKSCGVDVDIGYSYPFVYLRANEEDAFVQALEKELPNSLFLEKVEAAKEFMGQKPPYLPNGVGPCHRCIGEMLDPSSRRYYYPFTMCKACGSHASFLERYPLKRQNTLLCVFQPCGGCKEELLSNPWRADFALISCLRCNIPLRLSNASGTRMLYANEKEEYKELFGYAAAALRDGKSLGMKTLRGHFRFYLTPQANAKVLLLRPSEEFLMLASEKRALFSIERPWLHLTHSGGRVYEAAAVWDGFTTLLANELQDYDVLYFDEEPQSDFMLDFDLPITPYKAPRLFINKHKRCFKSGSQGLFPKFTPSQRVAIYDEWVSYEGIVDRVEHFDEIRAQSVLTFKNEEIEHSQIVRQDFAATLLGGVLRQNSFMGTAIGVYFGDEPAFYYLDKNRATKIFDFNKPHCGSTRKVVERFVRLEPKRYARFMQTEGFLEKAAALAGLELEEFERLALEFGGKGGLSIDCKIADDGFDYGSFYASMMSFLLAGTDAKLLAYSVYESLGEFMSQQAVEAMRKSKATGIALAGRHCTNSAFMSRFVRNYPGVLLPIEYPVDDEGVFAGI